MKGMTWITVIRVLLILLFFVNAGIFMALRKSTMVNPLVVIIVSTVMSIPISMQCANKGIKIIGFRRLILRILTWIILMSSILIGSFYCINYIGADSKSGTYHPAVVERKYYETRNRTRRVRHGRYINTGETYRIYYADIRLDNGHLTTIPLTGSDIARAYPGQPLTVMVCDGTFGVPVVITKNIFENQ